MSLRHILTILRRRWRIRLLPVAVVLVVRIVSVPGACGPASTVAWCLAGTTPTTRVGAGTQEEGEDEEDDYEAEDDPGECVSERHCVRMVSRGANRVLKIATSYG